MTRALAFLVPPWVAWTIVWFGWLQRRPGLDARVPLAAALASLAGAALGLGVGMTLHDSGWVGFDSERQRLLDGLFWIGSLSFMVLHPSTLFLSAGARRMAARTSGRTQARYRALAIAAGLAFLGLALLLTVTVAIAGAVGGGGMIG